MFHIIDILVFVVANLVNPIEIKKKKDKLLTYLFYASITP